MMKKVTVKQLTMLSLLMAMAWSASAQMKVGENPNAINKGSILELEAKDKGVLFPRVALTASNAWAPLQGTAVAGMTVYNTATVTATASATTSLSPGFYFWEGAKWNKLTTDNEPVKGAEWVYDADKNRINLIKSGSATFKDTIYYDNANGNFRRLGEDEAYTMIINAPPSFSNEERIDSLNGVLNISNASRFSSYNSKNHPSYANNNGELVKTRERNNYLINKSDASENQYSLSNNMFIPKENSNDYVSIYNTIAGNRLNGLGSISSSIGLWGAMVIGGSQSVIGYATGALNEASMRGAGSVGHLYGTNSRLHYLVGTGTVGVSAAINSYSDAPIKEANDATLVKENFGILNYVNSGSLNTGTGGVLAGIQSSTAISGKTKYPNMYGIISSTSVGSTATKPTNLYALYLGSATGATNSNYAIYTNAGKVRFGDNVTVAGSVTATSFPTSSDRRYKENVVSLSTALATIDRLKPVSYKWNAKGKEQGGDDKEHLGFIAQELEKVLPNLVQTDKEGYKSVNYTEVIPVLTKAIQEQQEQIAAQQIENKQLGREIAELKTLVQQLLAK